MGSLEGQKIVYSKQSAWLVGGQLCGHSLKEGSRPPVLGSRLSMSLEAEMVGMHRLCSHACFRDGTRC
jgi:hypothetical protein